MADSVTQLQDQINTLCQLMFNYAGTLQRDAKAVRYARNSRSFFDFDSLDRRRLTVPPFVFIA